MDLNLTGMTYEQAMKDVHARVAASRSSFTVGMTLLPKEAREAMFALYAFCREVDDIVDESPTLDLRQRGLQLWRERIRALFHDQKHSDSITKALSVALERFPLVEEDFQTIIDGMAMDMGDPICGPTLAALDLYCDRVASAVGRASVRIFGDASENGLAVAHRLGRAFQLTNILRDLAEDAERGRLYLPEEILNRHGITTREALKVLRHPQLASACRDLAQLARQHFAKADAAMRLCPPAAMRPARIMRAYYGAILSRLIAADWRNPFKRVSLSVWQKVWLALKALF
jgi:presqualene diphosphate synthase